MKPYEAIRAKYEASEHDLPWGYWVEWHLRHGFLFNTPEFFAMGYPIIKGAELVPVLDGDCWYLFALAGSMSKCWSILPWPLPWVGFERILDGKREMRFYRLEDLRRHTPGLNLQHDIVGTS